jgi:hypothetical protein
MRAQRAMRTWLLALTLGSASAGGCAGSAPFSASFPNGGERVDQALARANAAPHGPASAVVVGVADAPRSLFAYDLSARRMLFRVPAEAHGVPSIAGELVVASETTKVTVRRLRDGVLVQEFPLDGMHLIGADGDGTLSAIVLSTGGTMNVRSRLLLLSGERVSADRSVTRGLGAPAVRGGVAFVPHQRVHVSLVDARGEELARVRIREDVASRAFVHGGQVYFGQRGFYRLDGELDRGIQGGAHYWKLDLKTKLPGAPPLLADSTVAPAPIESALHRVALGFAPAMAESGQLALQDDTLYLAFYKQLFALSPDGTVARWVYETASDVVGVHAVAGGLLAVESSGLLTAIDAQGRAAFSAELGLQPIAAKVRAERIALATQDAEPAPLTTQLERAAQNPDTRLVPARAFAAQLLGGVESDDAARVLIALCDAENAPGRVREQACTTLSQRRYVSDAVLAALRVRANFLEGRRAPPLTPLARAALQAGDRRAAPELLAHLADPATPSEDLPALLRAVAGLGDASSAESVSAFVRLYHADAGDEQLEETLTVAMEALIKLDAGRARGVLEPLANDQFARVGVRTAAQRKLDELGPAAPEEGSELASEAAGHPDASPAAVPVAVESGPPAHLTTQHLDDALSAVRPKLSRCVREAPEHPASARLVLVIGGEGEVLDVRALPESVKGCVDPLVRSAQFPATKYGRRAVMSYSVSR